MVGDTLIEFVVAPVFQEYVVAPPPVIVTDVPLQIVDADAVAVTVGVVFTFKVSIAVLEQPFVVPLTVYVVVVVGDTLIAAVVAPVFQE